MNTLFIVSLIISVFAVHRITLLFTKDDGPAWIFQRLRNLPSRTSSAWEGIRCIRCVSIWAAGAVTAFLWLADIITGLWFIPITLALSGAAICLERITARA